MPRQPLPRFKLSNSRLKYAIIERAEHSTSALDEIVLATVFRKDAIYLLKVLVPNPRDRRAFKIERVRFCEDVGRR